MTHSHSPSTTSSSNLFSLFPPGESPPLTLLLHHLHNTSHNDSPGIVPYLINLLYSVPLWEVQPYIPQLLNIYLLRLGSKPSSSSATTASTKVDPGGALALERFLLDGCMSNWMFGCIVYWECLSMAGTGLTQGGSGAASSVITAMQQNSSPLTVDAAAASSSNALLNQPPVGTVLGNHAKMAQLACLVEKAIFDKSIPIHLGGKNHRRSASTSNNSTVESSASSTHSHQDADSIMSNILIKHMHHRKCAFRDMIYFVDFLTNLTRRLLIYPLGPMRSARLRLELRQFLNQGAMPYHVFWPLGSSRDYYERIVNVCVDECFALSTKERVPCLVFMEVIRDTTATNAEPPHDGGEGIIAGRHRSSTNRGHLSISIQQEERRRGGGASSATNAGATTLHRKALSDDGLFTTSMETDDVSSVEDESEDGMEGADLSSTDSIVDALASSQASLDDLSVVGPHKRSMSMSAVGGSSSSGSTVPGGKGGESKQRGGVVSGSSTYGVENSETTSSTAPKPTSDTANLTPSTAPKPTPDTANPTSSAAPKPTPDTANPPHSTASNPTPNPHTNTTDVQQTHDSQNANMQAPLNHTTSQTNTKINKDNLPKTPIQLDQESDNSSQDSTQPDDDDSNVEYLNPPHTPSTVQTPSEFTKDAASIALNKTNIESQLESPIVDGTKVAPHASNTTTTAHHHHHHLPDIAHTPPPHTQLNYDSDDEFLIVDVPDNRNELMDSVFGESWEQRRQRIRQQSVYGQHPHWDLRSFIVKSNDDIRQEEFCMQLIRLFKMIWIEEKSIPVHVCDYSIFPTSNDSGLIETIRDAVSYDTLIKKFKGYTSLLDYFISVYGEPGSTEFRQAQTNFTESMAAYSVICYLLQLKDRHNGNIMIDREGRVVHIDFGFFLGSSPGNLHFENVPFKLTKAFAQVIAGRKDNPEQSDMFAYFRILFGCCFRAAVENKDRILDLVRSMLPTALTYPCFEHVRDGEEILRRLDERFHANLKDGELETVLAKLIDDSFGAQLTKAYDWFQYQTNGLLYEI